MTTVDLTLKTFTDDYADLISYIDDAQSVASTVQEIALMKQSDLDTHGSGYEAEYEAYTQRYDRAVHMKGVIAKLYSDVVELRNLLFQALDSDVSDETKIGTIKVSAFAMYFMHTMAHRYLADQALF